MSKCFCPQPRQVRLLDGSSQCCCSEAWRHECEARDLFQVRDLTERRLRISRIEARRGYAAARALDATIDALTKFRDRARTQARGRPQLFD